MLRKKIRAAMAQPLTLDNHFFNRVVVRDEVDRLQAVLRAVPKWEAAAEAEVKGLAVVDLLG
jgi:hypothetical protein